MGWGGREGGGPERKEISVLVLAGGRNLAMSMSLQYFPFSFLSNKQYFLSSEGSGFTIDSTGTISTPAVFDFESEARR